MKSILHTDGNVYEILDQIADSGIDAFQAIDPIAGMDIVKVKEMVGDRLALCGNIHLGLLQNGPIEDIKSEVQRVCENCKPGGGFVLGATNAVFEEITTENYMAMMDANREYGRYKS